MALYLEIFVVSERSLKKNHDLYFFMLFNWIHVSYVRIRKAIGGETADRIYNLLYSHFCSPGTQYGSRIRPRLWWNRGNNPILHGRRQGVRNIKATGKFPVVSSWYAFLLSTRNNIDTLRCNDFPKIFDCSTVCVRTGHFLIMLRSAIQQQWSIRIDWG